MQMRRGLEYLGLSDHRRHSRFGFLHSLYPACMLHFRQSLHDKDLTYSYAPTIFLLMQMDLT